MGGKAGKGELDEQLREYINEWRKQRSKEEEELKRLKEKQAKRKEIRAEKEKTSHDASTKGETTSCWSRSQGPKKTDSGMGNVQDARREMTKTKEQLEEEKKISLSIRIKPLDLDAMMATNSQTKHLSFGKPLSV